MLHRYPPTKRGAFIEFKYSIRRRTRTLELYETVVLFHYYVRYMSVLAKYFFNVTCADVIWKSTDMDACLHHFFCRETMATSITIAITIPVTIPITIPVTIPIPITIPIT